MNCIHLKDFFSAKANFEQALYLLQGAMTLLPEDPTKRKRLRATLQINIGLLYLDILTAHNLGQTSDQQSEKVVLFPQLKNEWPQLKPLSSYDDAVHTFKLGNT